MTPTNKLKEHPIASPGPEPDKYLPLMQDFDMEEAQKRELIHILWDILSRIADLGLQLDPLDVIFQVNEDRPSDRPAAPVKSAFNCKSKPQDTAPVSPHTATAQEERAL